MIRFLSRISIRLLAFNLLLVFLPVFGILSLETYEQELLRYQERSMVQQGRLLAAALSSRQGSRGGGDLAAEAEEILVNLDRQVDARLRVVGADFTLLADSSRLGPRGEQGVEIVPEAGEEIRDNLLYRVGNFLYSFLHSLSTRFWGPPEPPLQGAGFYATRSKLVGPEIEAALRGQYGSATRRTAGQRSLTLYSALPIWNAGRDEVVGAVLVSKSTFQILGSLYELRLSTFQVVLASALAAIALSLLLATTINRPIRRLQQASRAILDRRGRLKGRFRAYRRQDEIGDLSRALAELTRRLHEHLRFTESFASDVSHEFKNPLASIRTATDLLEEVDDPEERKRFVAMIQRDVARLERLLSAVREITQIDARSDEEPPEVFDLRILLGTLHESYELRHPEIPYRLELPDDEVRVEASPDRITQVLENLLDNATGFSPEGEAVTISLERRDDDAVVRVADRGPGIPGEHREKIFDRFFSYRPEGHEGREGGAADGHTGLGLSIARAIAEAAGGSLETRNGEQRGAIFELRLPLAP